MKPGEHVVLFFKVSGNQTLSEKISTNLVLPQNWQILTQKTDNPKGQKSEETYVYTVNTPSQAEAGEYTLVFTVSENGFVKARKEIRIIIERVRKLEVTPLSFPEYLREGDVLKVEYLIQNLGNEKEKLTLKTSRGKIENSKDEYVLEKNESMKVWVKQDIGYSDENMWLATSDLTLGFKDTSEVIYQVKSIPVYANKNKKNDPYLRFPIEVSVLHNSYSGSTVNRQGLQYEVKGAGYLDFSRNNFLSFLAHGPSQTGFPYLGTYEQYSLRYTHKESSLTLGDYNLQISNLLELSRFGRGFKFDQNFKKTSFSVFFIEPRFYPDIKRSLGGSFFYKASPNIVLGFNYVSKFQVNNQVNAQDTFWANILSTTIGIKKENFWLDAELSGSQGNGRADFGVYSSLSFSKNNFRIYNNIVYAGKQFYGFYNNSWLLNNSVHYAISKKITVGVINNYNRINPGLDSTVYSQSPFYVGNVAEVIYRVNKLSRVVLSYNLLHREDRFEPKKFDYKEEFLRYTYFLNTLKFNLWLDGNYGYTHNLLVSPDISNRKISIRNMIQPEVKIGNGLSIGMNLEYLRTNRFSLKNEVQNYLYYGGTLRVQVKKYFSLSVMYRNNYAMDEFTERRTFFDMQATLNLRNHQLSLIGSQAYFPNVVQQNTLYFGLKYTLKINAPIAKNKRLSTLRGQIVGPENTRKEGILLQIGDQKFITDANGKFVFNNLVPNKYYVNVVRSSMNVDDIAAIQTPVEIDLKADSISFLNIPLTKSGAIIGKIQYEKSQFESDISKNKPNILAKLYNEKESFVTQINKEGNGFSFKEIKPGKWKIQVWIPGNQGKYLIETAASSELNIEPESRQELNFKVKIAERKIHFTENTFRLTAKE